MKTEKPCGPCFSLVKIKDMRHFKKNRNRKHLKIILLTGLIVFVIWYCNCIPDRLFNDSTSTVLLDHKGNLLGAKIADDGQWRFSPVDSVPKKFATCLLQFEDREFYLHPGISARGIGRAIVQNIKSKRIVSGGSTITMQVVRIMRKNPKRKITEKALELILATRMEIRFNKDEILNFYASHAPFGNNVVGLEAASWRYFGRSSDKLSWAESATLAVLPNAPGLIYPGKNHDRLLKKRNRLLKRLHDIKVIDEFVYQLALSEPLPGKPLPLPQLAPHLLIKLSREGHKGKTIISTIDKNIQEQAVQQLQSHSEFLQENKIYNGAILITSVNTGEVLAYVANTKSELAEHCSDVNCIEASRSTGSILKPFLYAKCLEDGLITPGMLVSDIPSQFGSYTPKNFTAQYDGAVPANKALARSLNIPMVRLLNEYGLSKFHNDLKNLGLTTINKPSLHYGLSLILGGAEAKLSELSAAYTHLAQELKFDKTYPVSLVLKNEKSFPCPLRMGIEMESKHNSSHSQSLISNHNYSINKACIYSTFEAMVDVNRPDEDGNWRAFTSAQKIAWKTGTSFGFRDGWAIGVSPDYVVAVWVGNADGEGRPGLTGVKAAAPLLFTMFGQLPKSESWFRQPVEEMTAVVICRESGHRASDLCDQRDMKRIPKSSLGSASCPYHQIVHLNKITNLRVDSECESVFNMKHVSWFILPPLIEKYYKFNHPNYKILPDFKPECRSKISDRALALLYPKPNTKIYVPIEIDGNTGRTIFEATHRNIDTKIYWHLDDNYIGETKEIHQLALNPPIGKHKLMLVDENGISISLKFEVVGEQ